MFYMKIIYGLAKLLVLIDVLQNVGFVNFKNLTQLDNLVINCTIDRRFFSCLVCG